MKIKLFFIAFLFPFLFYSCNKNEDCSVEQINQKQENFKLAYQNWKEALNYMDADVITTPQKILDSSYQVLANCISVDSNLTANVDSISLIFTNHNIKRVQIEKAEKMAQKLDEFVNSMAADREKK